MLRSNHKKILIFDGRNAPRDRNFISQLNQALKHESDTLVITIDNDGFIQIHAQLFFSMRLKREDDDLIICMIYKWLHDLIDVTIVTNDKSEIRQINIALIAATSPHWKEDKVEGFSSVRKMTFRKYLSQDGMVWDYSASQPASLDDVRGGSVRGGSVRGGSVRGGSVRDGSVRGGSVRDGSVRGGDASSPSPPPPALASSPPPPALASSPSPPALASSPPPPALASASVPPGLCFHCGKSGHKKFQCPHLHVFSRLSVTEVDARSLSAASTATTPNRAHLFLAEVAAGGDLKPQPKAGDKVKK